MILVSINAQSITIVEDGKRLILAKDTILYNKLKDKTKNEIAEWHKSRNI